MIKSSSVERIVLGKSAEQDAVTLLEDSGYKILARNYKSKLGEIDIVACDKDTVCFIEVKSRSSQRFGSPAEAVAQNKQRHIARAALRFLKVNNLFKKKARFDVVSVFYSAGKPKLNLIKNAFELDGAFSY